MANKAKNQPIITIDPNGYEGIMSFNTASPPAGEFFYFDGPKTFPVEEGEYHLNTGTSIGGKTGANTSYIYFNVNKAGEVELRQTNSASLSADKKTITLKTISHTIDLGGYQNNYALSAKHGTALSGKQGNLKITLVRHQLYEFDSGVHQPAYLLENGIEGPPTGVAAKSWFFFFIDESGVITFYDQPANLTTPTSVYASFENGELKLKTVKVSIDPAEISNNSPIQLLDGTVVNSREEQIFLRGLMTLLSWQTKKSSYYFVPM